MLIEAQLLFEVKKAGTPEDMLTTIGGSGFLSAQFQPRCLSEDKACLGYQNLIDAQ
jgi:hypothetical protein